MNFLFGGGYIIPWVTTTSSNGSYTEFTLKKQGPYTNVINARGDNHILPPSCHFVSWKWGRQTPTLPETNVAPANWWLEDVISYWEGLVSGARNFRRVLWVSHLFRCISKQALQPLSAGGIRRDRSSGKAFPSAVHPVKQPARTGIMFCHWSVENHWRKRHPTVAQFCDFLWVAPFVSHVCPSPCCCSCSSSSSSHHHYFFRISYAF